MTQTLPSGPPDLFAAPPQAPPEPSIQEKPAMWKYAMTFPARAAVVSAAFVASAAMVTAIGAMFDSASREPWVRDSPQIRAAMARCQSKAAPADRGACARRVIAEARSPAPKLAQLAGSVSAR